MGQAMKTGASFFPTDKAHSFWRNGKSCLWKWYLGGHRAEESQQYQPEAVVTVRASIPSGGCTYVQLRPERAQAIHTLLDNTETQKTWCKVQAGQT